MDFSDHTEYEHEVFENTNLSDSRVIGRTFYKCRFENCTFSEADFSTTVFESCTFINSSLILLNFTETRLHHVSFQGCKLMGINFTLCDTFVIDFSFKGCRIEGCNFSELKVPKTVLTESLLIETDFVNADFSGADFTLSDFRECLFNNTNLTSSTFVNARGYKINPLNNSVKKAKFSLPEAAVLLEALEVVIL